ncbi:MAG: hypothetical protein AAFO69_20720 [Bacteroidota bacterium]
MIRKSIAALFLGVSLLLTLTAVAQPTEREAMAKLSFLAGDWQGQGKLYQDDGTTKSYRVEEKVDYELSGDILVIRVNAEVLQLHTVVYYDVTEGQYYYSRYTKEGGKKYPGKYEEGKFKVRFSDARRLVFERDENGRFHEYGEKLVDGKWVIYFEDTLSPAAP